MTNEVNVVYSVDMNTMGWFVALDEHGSEVMPKGIALFLDRVVSKVWPSMQLRIEDINEGGARVTALRKIRAKVMSRGTLHNAYLTRYIERWSASEQEFKDSLSAYIPHGYVIDSVKILKPDEPYNA